MKIKSWIITKRWQRHLHYFVKISRMHNLHTFNIVKMSITLGRHFAVSTKPRLSKTSCLFEGGSSPSKCKKGKTCLRTLTCWRCLLTNYIPLKWRLKMKRCTWYFSWTFPHLLIIWSQVWNPCPLRMLTFSSSSFDCFMRFPKENKVKVWKMSHCLTKFIKQMKSFAFIIKNSNILWRIVWRKRVMKKKRQTKLVKIKNKCLLLPWVLMIIRRMIGSWILAQHNRWHLNESGSPTYKSIVPWKVYMGNDTILETIGKGNIKAIMQIGDKMLLRTITQVLHVPKMKNSLISVSKFILEGLKVEFDKDGYKVNNVHWIVVVEARREKNLYFLNVNLWKENANVAKFSNERTMLWHQWFGHLNMESLKKLEKMVNDMNLKEVPLHDLQESPLSPLCCWYWCHVQTTTNSIILN